MTNPVHRRGAFTSVARIALLVGGILVAPSPCGAVLGPEQVFVVVNQNSWSSRAVANQFVRLNRIPASHVLSVDWEDSVVSTSLKDFRQRLLAPIQQALKQRKLENQISCIAYSSDFPYAVELRGETPSLASTKAPHAQPGRFASLTGATYLHQLLDTPSRLRAAAANPYAGGPSQVTVPFSAFQSRGGQAQPQGYLLSVMLGYTSGRGNSVGEVIRYLNRAKMATGTDPPGTIYLLTNDNIRTKVRSGRFPQVSADLEQLGVASLIFRGSCPKNRRDIQGAVVGNTSLPISLKATRILPGAICENLTSFGGVLDDQGSQTPLTNLLRAGAAGSSGTVVEPYAIAAKFPDPAIQLHYARGLSLAESFYRSTKTPLELLVVGDPLCRPWGKLATVHVGDFEERQALKDTVPITPELLGATAAAFKLYVNGRLVSTCQPGQAFRCDTTTYPDGFHEFRVVAVHADPLQSQSYWIGWRQVNNQGLVCEAFIDGPRIVPLGTPVRIQCKSTQPMQVSVFYQRRNIGETRSGQVVIDSDLLGLGPNELQVAGIDETGRLVFAEPVSLFVTPPAALPAMVRGVAQPLILTRLNGTSTPLNSRPTDWLERAGVGRNEAFVISGDLSVEQAGLHQLQVDCQGRLSIRLDGQLVLERNSLNRFSREEVPLTLA
ncbi:MAG: TIGR03790 family protein, partial [Planctomycetota bacterium]